MLDYLKRLVTTGAAYQFGDILAKALALLTLPLYTRHVSPDGYGAAETLLTAVILVSILLRVGVGEAFIRFYFDDDRRGAPGPHRPHRDRDGRVDDDARLAAGARLRRAAVAAAARLPRPAADRLRGPRAVGVHEPRDGLRPAARRRTRARTYLFASGANVSLTVSFTVVLVVFADQGARGLLLGNFGASAVVVLALWWVLRHRFSLRARRSTTCGRCSASGCRRCRPTRACTRCRSSTASTCSASTRTSAAGLYAVAIKLATVVFVAVRGFQYAWPPLAYSIESDEEAARPVLAGDDLLRARHRRGGGRGGAAGPLDGAAAARPRSSTAPTVRCPGWRSAGRCTGCTSCSSSSPAARG